ncbi:MAG: LLM class flavin-dependent oxidoreductase, partial [Candidatus Bathyarchaeia archaeon]
MVKFGVGLFSDKHTRTLAEYIKLADELGFDYAWVSSQFFNRNAFVTLTYASTITKRIKLGTGVVNPYFRHPSMLAQGAASLNEVSNGRAVLGIGSGMVEGPETSPAYPLEDRLRIGKPLKATREAIEIVKGLLSG